MCPRGKRGIIKKKELITQENTDTTNLKIKAFS